MNIFKKLFKKDITKETIDTITNTDKLDSKTYLDKDDIIIFSDKLLTWKNIFKNSSIFENYSTTFNTNFSKINTYISNKEKYINLKEKIYYDDIIFLKTNTQNLISNENIKINNINQNIIDISKYQKNILEIKNINSKLDEITIEKNVKTISSYENFSKYLGYIHLKKINNFFIILSNSTFKEYIYSNLGDLIINYENDLNIIFSELEKYILEIKELNIKTKSLELEINNFTNLYNNTRKKGQLALKEQYEKLSRSKNNLTKKRDLLVKEENILNSKLSQYISKISSLNTQFEEISGFVHIYLDEKQIDFENTITINNEEKNKYDKNEIKIIIDNLNLLVNILEEFIS